jgi:hypothetical protein
MLQVILQGIDLRINGELVPGCGILDQSFISQSKGKELDGVQHLKREVGEAEGSPVKDVPRPTDQFLALNVFFRPILPNNVKLPCTSDHIYWYRSTIWNQRQQYRFTGIHIDTSLSYGLILDSL